MVRIPLIRRQHKSDSNQPEVDKEQPSHSTGVKDGKKQPSLPASPPDEDVESGQYVLGTDKKIPLPGKTSKHEAKQVWTAAPVDAVAKPPVLPEKHVEEQPRVHVKEEPAESPFVARVLVPGLRPETPDVTQAPEVAVVSKPNVPPVLSDKHQEKQVEAAIPKVTVVEKTPSREMTRDSHQPQQPSGGGTDQASADALAILGAVPDYIFRLSQNGISPVVGDSKAAADGGDKSRLPGKLVLEELTRQSQQHARKVLESRQPDTFEFQVSDDSKKKYHLEARLMPFRQSEALAVVRDVTLRKQANDALIESRKELEDHLKDRNAELMRVNKMLKTEVELREEQEEILKKNFRRLESLLDDTIGAITLIVERRDPHVADHQRRVCQFACAIAQEMNSRSDRMRAVRMAAQLHDLGKTFIPAEILRKPGKLTDAEMSMIKTHPDTDYQILKRINFPISIADVVRQHHERLDGSGYPQGLKGDAILIEARILAVADVVEGMIFERPYRVAPGLDAALKEIADNKGKLYDTAVADACLKLFAEKRFQFEPMPVQENAMSASQAQYHRDM